MSLTPRTHDEGRSRLVAYDHGAHLASWHVDREPVLWLSDAAVLDGSTPIRGGIPICFPWFADGPDGQHSPSHGVVRTATWHPEPTGNDLWAWALTSDDVMDAPGARLVPGPFRARYAVRLGRAGDQSPTLEVELTIQNTGSSDYRVEAALHTYLEVSDVQQVTLYGLEGAGYLDKVTGRREQQVGSLRLGGETDRVYDRSGPVIVEDPDGGRSLRVDPRGATQTVVWNPWAEQAAGLVDVAPGSWRRFVCVETAATADHALQIAAGASSTLGFTLGTHPVGVMWKAEAR